MDPLTATGGNFEMRARYFNDGLTFDQSKDDLIRDLVGNTKKWITALMSFDKTFGAYTLNSHLTYAKGGSQTQYSIGAIHKLSKNFKGSLIYRNQKIETLGNGTVAGTSKTNKASTIMLGVTLSL